MKILAKRPKYFHNVPSRKIGFFFFIVTLYVDEIYITFIQGVRISCKRFTYSFTFKPKVQKE